MDAIPEKEYEQAWREHYLVLLVGRAQWKINQTPSSKSKEGV